MSFPFKKSLYSLALIAALGSFTPIALANHPVKKSETVATAANENQSPRQQVETQFKNWQQALAGGNAAAIVNLYYDDAVLLATLHNNPIDNQKERTAYFTELTKKKNLQVKVDQQKTRMIGDVAIITGTYTFMFDDDAGKTVNVPARYDFVYQNLPGKGWMIVTHHSSKMPIAE